MKRILILLLTALLLCGCTAEPPVEETTVPTETEAEIPTEPAGSYEPGSELETGTDGAVRVYPQDLTDVYAMACVGSDVLLFSGKETTTLTMLSGDNLYKTAQVAVDMHLAPEQSATQVTNRGMSYYSDATGEVILLDEGLKEVARIATPKDMVGTPILSANRQSVFYCTAGSIRVLELETGISRLLKEITGAELTTEALLLNDTVLRCRLTDEDGNVRSIFLSTENGETHWETEEPLEVDTYGEYYYSVLPEGSMEGLVFGHVGDSQRMLLPADVTAPSWYLPAMHGAVSAVRDLGGNLLMEYYELSGGRRSSVLQLPCSEIPCSVEADATRSLIYVLCVDESGAAVIYRWEPGALQTNDGNIYTGPRYTLENMDTEALAACRAYATDLNQRYGVEILIGTDATAKQPWTHRLETEYQAPMIRLELEKLNALLAVYPEGFLKQAASGTESGVLRICLVRGIQGTPESGNMERTNGIQYWIEENPYVALCVGRTDEKLVHHQLFHAIETKVFSDSQLYYEWDALNPKGFSYDYNFDLWQTREETKYLEGKNRAFIDSFSMTFPNEDRARIMEYAITADNESCFESDSMQKKLLQLCRGIRKAFGLEKSEDVYPWEQYLEESIAYVPKKK